MTVPAFSAKQPLFDRYESVRQALISARVENVQTSARDLASAARSAKLDAIAASAGKLAAVTTLDAARSAFGQLSRDVIAYRERVSGDRPVVAYCSMKKESWLQPTAKPIGNPYVGDNMRACGEVVNR